jgi:hypothetical protein
MKEELEDGAMSLMGLTDADEDPLCPVEEGLDVESVAGEITTADIKVPPAAPLNKGEVSQAMRELGLTNISVKKWERQALITDYLEQVGAFKVGVGEYAATNTIRDRVIHKCLDVLEGTDKPIEASVIAGTIGKLLDGKDKSTSEMIKAATAINIGQPKEDAGPRMAPKGSQIIAVQVNTKQ